MVTPNDRSDENLVSTWPATDFLRKGDVLMVTRIDRLAAASATYRTSCAQ